MWWSRCTLRHYTCSTLPDGAISALQVLHSKLRPEFPAWTPEHYAQLAERCWSVDPARRPSAEELVQVSPHLLIRMHVPYAVPGCTCLQLLC